MLVSQPASPWAKSPHKQLLVNCEVLKKEIAEQDGLKEFILLSFPLEARG